MRISFELEQKIREMVKCIKSKRRVAEELGVSRDTVIKYTRDIPSRNKERKRSSELIEQIRNNVQKYNSKSKTARVMGLSYDTVKWYTKDIPIKKSIFIKSQKEKSRRKNINGKSLDLLKELMKNGYAFSSKKYNTNHYIKLRKYFPNIQRTKMYGKMIYYLDDKSKIAAKAFLDVLNKKVMSYQELKQVAKVFDNQLIKKISSRILKHDFFISRSNLCCIINSTINYIVD